MHNEAISYDITSPRVAGAIRFQQPPSLYLNTLRPDPMLTSIQTVVIIPPDEAVKVAQSPTQEDIVFQLMQAAYPLDLRQDQPYMSLPHMMLKEAVIQLRRKGCLLIQGGSLHFGLVSGGLYAKPLGKTGLTHITTQQAIRLLKINYPLPMGAKRLHPVQLETHDTEPCDAPFARPVPVGGFAFYTGKDVDYGGDIDNIKEEQWHVCTLNRVYEGLLFIGDTVVGGGPCYCWYSLKHCCYVAQSIPSE